MVRIVVMSSVIGLVCGMLFGVLYFGAGQITNQMVFIHDASGTLLGAMIGLIIGFARKASKKG